MFDLTAAFNRAKSIARHLLGSRARGRSFAAARMNADGSDIASINCFREANLGRAPAADCLEFLAPNGKLIWEQQADADP